MTFAYSHAFKSILVPSERGEWERPGAPPDEDQGPPMYEQVAVVKALSLAARGKKNA